MKSKSRGFDALPLNPGWKLNCAVVDELPTLFDDDDDRLASGRLINADVSFLTP